MWKISNFEFWICGLWAPAVKILFSFFFFLFLFSLFLFLCFFRRTPTRLHTLQYTPQAQIPDTHTSFDRHEWFCVRLKYFIWSISTDLDSMERTWRLPIFHISSRILQWRARTSAANKKRHSSSVWAFRSAVYGSPLWASWLAFLSTPKVIATNSIFHEYVHQQDNFLWWFTQTSQRCIDIRLQSLIDEFRGSWQSWGAHFFI